MSHPTIHSSSDPDAKTRLPFKGSCLCGAVQYECSAEPLAAGHCQCIDCRKSSGTGHGSHIAAPKSSVIVSGQTKEYDKAADNGNVVSRHFCPNCGSPVYSTNSGYPDMLFIRASSLDDLEIFQPQMVVYTKRGAAWDYLDPKLPTFETQPALNAVLAE